MSRVCILTGASGVLGDAFISRFAETYTIIGVHDEHPVPCASQDQEFFDPITLVTQPEAGHVWTVRADLTDPAAADRIVAAVASHVSDVDLLVNCAAMREWHPLLDPAAVRTAPDILALNVLAPLRLSVTIAHQFWSRDIDANLAAGRNIVNISSSAGLFVYPDLGQGMYATSKAALNHMTYHLASEFWNIGVRVNAVAPDTFPTRVPIEDVLDAIATLDSGTATGQIVPLYRANGETQ